MTSLSPECAQIDALCRLTLNPQQASEAVQHLESLDAAGRAELLKLADSHHVVVRAMSEVAAATEKAEVRQWAHATIAVERERITNALEHLEAICTALDESGCCLVVMKTLDHWPDFGNDLDLFTTAPERAVLRVMSERFKAKIEPRSWGDRLANKWNFAVPGLPESVEVHVRRLGQTGEHISMARLFCSRRMPVEVSGHKFMVPAPEERIIVATLQRMYRHFYFRVCDVVNAACLVDSGAVNFEELKRASDIGGVWPGVATFLQIVSDYVERYRGTGLALPERVRAAAQFGGSKVQVRDRFLRVPMVPEGAALYTRQVTTTALRGDVPATFRLTLLPTLASAAAVAHRITGSDKGIW